MSAVMQTLVFKKTPEQLKLEKFYATRGVIGCWNLDSSGEYANKFARDAWSAWQAAQAAMLEQQALAREFGFAP